MPSILLTLVQTVNASKIPSASGHIRNCLIIRRLLRNKFQRDVAECFHFRSISFYDRKKEINATVINFDLEL